MKKYLLLIFIAIGIGIAIPCKVDAADISIGLTSWYSWYEPLAAADEDYDVDPAFLLGPALSFKFNDDFNLTFVFLTGKYDNLYTIDFGSGIKSELNSKIKRYDADLALNYRLNNYFKIFAGLKYLSYSTNGYMKFPVNSAWYVNTDTDSSSYGPGLGISCTYPITDNIFLLSTLSGFYLWNKNENSFKYSTVFANSFTPPLKDSTAKYNGKLYGFNSTLSIAYYIPAISTVISLGGRYQYFIDEDNVTERCYGITLTATYSFSF